MTVTQEQYDRRLAELIDEEPASHLLAVPGVYEALTEDAVLHNAVLRSLEEDPP